MARHELWLTNSEDNPRNSEGAFVTLHDGRIMFVYSRYRGTSWIDDACADLAVCYSSDEGLTWTDSQVLFSCPDEADNLMSVSLLRLSDDSIGLLYLVKKSSDDCGERMLCYPVFRKSTDEGQSWSNVVRPSANRQLCVNNDRLVQLSTGRLIIPCAMSAKAFTPDGLSYRPQYSYITYSDDCGLTWYESLWNIYAPVNSSTGLQEPGVIELSNGALLLWGRTDLGCQYQCQSTDYGKSWSDALPSKDFTCTVTPLTMKRDPLDNRLIAIWADASPRWGIAPIPDNSWDRTPLAIAFSHDEGQTWTGKRLLEKDPMRGYCYIALHFTQTAILLAYCCGGHGKECLQELKIVRLSRDELAGL